MTDVTKKTLRDDDIRRLVVAADDVACVSEIHTADHALLVLIKSGYSAIPVLSQNSRVVGTVSKTQILDAILGLERIEFERLRDVRVVDVMKQSVPRLTPDQTFLRAVQMAIENPFLCVEDEAGKFIGLLTRRGILAYVHQILRPLEDNNARWSEKRDHV